MTADSKKIDDGGLAFPGVRAEQVGNLSDYGPTDDDAPTFAEVHHPGMTLRDWFAGQALSGLCANPGGPFQANSSNGWDIVNCDAGHVAAWCHELADAMIKARGRS